MKSQPHHVWPRAFQPQQLPSTWLAPGCSTGALDTYPGSWDAASARSTRHPLRRSISKAWRHCQQVPCRGRKSLFLWLPQHCFFERFLAAQGCTRCPRGEVLQDTSPVLGKVSPGLVGTLVSAWWQRMEAGDGPSHFGGTNTIYSKHVSQDICGDRASVNIICTQTAEGAGLGPPLLQSSQGWNLGAGEKVPLVCFYILYTHL